MFYGIKPGIMFLKRKLIQREISYYDRKSTGVRSLMKNVKLDIVNKISWMHFPARHFSLLIPAPDTILSMNLCTKVFKIYILIKLIKHIWLIGCPNPYKFQQRCKCTSLKNLPV